MGVVNNRIDIDALERASGGGGGGGGLVLDTLWSGTLSTTAATAELSAAYTDYKLIGFAFQPSATVTRGSELLAVSFISDAENASNIVKVSGTDVTFTVVDETHLSIKGGSSMIGVSLYGIK